VHHLLHRIAWFRDLIPLDFTALTVTAEKPAVSFDARVAKACWDESAEESDTVTRRPYDFDADVARYRARLESVRSAYATVTQLADRFQPMRVVNALAAVDNHWSSEMVLVSEVHFASPTLTIHGVALGEPARSAVVASFRRPGLETTRIDWSVAGECRAFTSTTTLGAVPSMKLVPSSKNIFDKRTSELCNTASPRSTR
jgi:sirohydrochlorin ferrochelatase